VYIDPFFFHTKIEVLVDHVCIGGAKPRFRLRHHGGLDKWRVVGGVREEK